jgi:hypothetical protein
MDKRRKELERFIGEWTMQVTFPGAPPMTGGRVVFEWMTGEQFIIEGWEVPVPEAPDGTFRQHYFDSRGIARIYQMRLEDGVWTLWRDTADFSPLDFAQRYTGRFSEDGTAIAGRWEIAHDGSTWEHDFDLTYLRVG